MSQDQEFYIKNVITGKDVVTEDNTAVLPLFACSQYKIKAYFKSSAYAKSKYRKAVRWDFGDGTVIEGSSAEHYYSTPGKYRITCTFYNIDRRPYESENYIDVIVKEIIPLNLEIINNEVKADITRSKITRLCSLQATMGSNVATMPPIIINRINNDKGQKSYFDIRNEKYYHLQRYHTFLKESVDYTYKKDIVDKITLAPSRYFIPKLAPLYVKFNAVDDKIIPDLYVYIENEKYKLPETYNIYNPEASVLTNHSKNYEDYYYQAELKHIGYMSDLPEDAEHCGWIGVENIWYKDDYIGENKLYICYDTSYLKFKDEKLSPTAINIPPLGVKINVQDNEDETIYALTGNGLLKEYDEAGENGIVLEKHLQHNFYTDYHTEAYSAKYIKNESFDGSTTWSIYKGEETIPALTGTMCNIDKQDDNINYIDHYILQPIAQGFTLELDGKTYTNERLRSLGSIRLPEKNYVYISFTDMLNAYMQHPMYEDKDVIKQFFHQIFETDYLFENINNKGFGFFDDIVNHKTCYINNLKSILEMFGNDVKDYNVTGFDKINELRELIRLLSMQYSELFGQYEIVEQDIAVNGDRKGKCVGDRILPTDVIVCDATYQVIGLIRDDKFYKNPVPTKNLILVDDFNKTSRLVSLDGVASLSYHPLHETLKHNTTELNYYTLNDYDYTWGWNLKAPADTINAANKGTFLDAYYSLYMYDSTQVTKERRYNFLAENTMPYSQLPSTTYMTPDEWADNFGHTYDCLMKVLLYKLGLNK